MHLRAHRAVQQQLVERVDERAGVAASGSSGVKSSRRAARRVRADGDAREHHRVDEVGATQRRRRREEAELRPAHAGGAGHDGARREVAEDRRRPEHVHAHLNALRIQVAVARAHAVRRACVERAQDVGDELRRMTQPPVVRLGLDVAARLGVEQDGADDGLEIAARVRAAAIEDRRDPGDVGRARVARDQVLNQLLRDERADVRIVEDVVDRVVQVPGRALARGQHHAVQQGLRLPVVLGLVGHHRVDVVRHARSGRGRETPAGEDASEVVDVVLRVGRNRLSLVVELRRAIDIEPHSTDREQLQDLARVVLVRPGARVVVDVEVVPHRRIERDVVEQLAVVAERVAIEDLKVGRHPAWLRDFDAGDDDDLVQRERDALAQLIFAVERVHEEPVLQRVHRVVVALTGRSVRAGGGVARRRIERQRRIARDRRLELLLEECLEADLADVLDQLGRRSPRRLFEEPHDVGAGRRVFSKLLGARLRDGAGSKGDRESGWGEDAPGQPAQKQVDHRRLHGFDRRSRHSPAPRSVAVRLVETRR